jgi:hypothetical protein
MPDLAMISAAISAATSAIGLFDKMADEIERFMTKRPEPKKPVEHRFKVEGEPSAIVTKRDGQMLQRVTAAELGRLPDDALRHITVLEQSMNNHYAIWESLYPQLALLTVGVEKTRIELQLRQVIQSMKGDLDGILTFLRDSGLQLDDHYLHIRNVIASA